MLINCPRRCAPWFYTAQKLRGEASKAARPPWSARPSHACWLTWSSWAAAYSGGPSWRPTSKRFRVRAGSLHLSSRRLLSAALLAVRRRWQGECCDEADDGKGRYDGGGGAEHPQREAEGRRGRDPGGAGARRALGLLGSNSCAATFHREREREGSRCSLRTRHSPRGRVACCQRCDVAPPAPAHHAGRTGAAPWPRRAPRSASCNLPEEDSTLQPTW